MPRCTAKTRQGKRCRNGAMDGSERCASHLGRAKGPESILSEDITHRIAVMLQAGNYLDVACQAAGISRGVYRKWMAMGRDRKAHPLHATFRDRIETAKAIGEARNVTLIAEAARTNWQAAAWLLERQSPERWARVSQREKPMQGTPQPIPTPRPDDPFSEVDELAQRRRQSS